MSSRAALPPSVSSGDREYTRGSDHRDRDGERGDRSREDRYDRRDRDERYERDGGKDRRYGGGERDERRGERHGGRDRERERERSRSRIPKRHGGSRYDERGQLPSVQSSRTRIAKLIWQIGEIDDTTATAPTGARTDTVAGHLGGTLSPTSSHPDATSMPHRPAHEAVFPT